MTSLSAPLATRRTEEANDFSLVLGGPLFQFFRRVRLTGSALELVRRRIVVIVPFAWLPLLILSVIDGMAWGTAVKVPFLLDIDAQVRFLVALPLLIVAELVVHERTRTVVGQFVSQGRCAGIRRRRAGPSSRRDWLGHPPRATDYESGGEACPFDLGP